MSVQEIKKAALCLSVEERAEVAACLHSWKDDEWDEQIKRDWASGKLDMLIGRVDADIGGKQNSWSAVISRTHAQFWECFHALLKEIQRMAKVKYQIGEQDCFHPSLHCKPLKDNVWSVRIYQRYRALGRRKGALIVWFWIGKLLRSATNWCSSRHLATAGRPLRV